MSIIPSYEACRNWAIFLTLASPAVYYYGVWAPSKRRGRAGAAQPAKAAKRRTSQRRSSSAEPGSGSGNAKKKNRPTANGDAEASSSAVKPNKNAKAKNRKGGNAKSDQLAQSSAVDLNPPQEAVAGAQDAEADLDNRAFAEQMAGLKTGSTLANNESKSQNKTKKQGKQAEMPLNAYNPLADRVNGASNSKDLSNPSSATGADADDDLSSAASPQLTATQAAAAGDVSDMLEAPAKGPSVLRLTGVEEPKRKPKQQKVVQEAETKKQRQNRRKKEEQRAAREEDERERRVLLEKQLRSAREAEGRPAKNGMGSAPATSAWDKPSTNNVLSSSPAPPVAHEPLLDTFDDGPRPTVNGHRSQGQNTAAASKNGWHTEIPSEEEQLRILSEIEGNGGWNTVTTGKKRKPAASNDKENQRKTSSASLSGSISTSDDSNNQATPSRSQTEDESPQVPSKKVDIDRNVWNFDNIKSHPNYDPDYPHALLGHPGDSDWAVI